MASWLFALGNILLGVQAPLASVSGRISDAETGTPIAGVVVSVPALGRATLSDSLGRYLIDRLPAGTYELAARRIGYGRWSVEVLLPEGASVEVAFALRLEPIPVPEIQVRVPGPTVGGAVPLGGGGPVGFPERTLTSAELHDHPLIAEPDYFAGLAGGEVWLSPESPEGLHIAGGAADQVAFQLDGIPVLNPFHSAGTFGAWNPDVVASASLSHDPAGGPSGVLGGTLAGRTRAAAELLEVRGAVTASQTRLALSSPIGRDGGGALLGLRAGFPGLIGHKTEPSHLGGRNDDWTAKLDLPMLGGRFSLLGYGSGNSIGASPAGALRPAPPPDLEDHRFDWSSWSYGAGWTGPLADRLFQVRAWAATSDVGSRWIGSAGAEQLAASRRDLGISANIRGTGLGSTTTASLSLGTTRSDYRTREPGGPEGAMRLVSDLPLITGGVEQQRKLTDRSGLQLGLAATWTTGHVVLSPAAGLWWQPLPLFRVSANYMRRHQFNQSLRNPESVVGAVFPVDLTVGSGQGGVPVARGDLAVLAVDLRPRDGIRIGARAYLRRARGLALVALREAGPFSSGPAANGSSSTRGAVFEFEARRHRIELRAAYGYQHTRLQGEETRYQPTAAVPHTLDAGLTLFPGERWLFRLGISGQYGRHGTRITAPFEWEGCNLSDRGCEFIGSPELTGPLGGVALPAYFRIDLGLRHEWHASLLGRRGTLAAFGTVTNLLARRNILAVKENPTTGVRRPVEMRPRAPLVAGLEWRF